MELISEYRFKTYRAMVKISLNSFFPDKMNTKDFYLKIAKMICCFMPKKKKDFKMTEKETLILSELVLTDATFVQLCEICEKFRKLDLRTRFVNITILVEDFYWKGIFSKGLSKSEIQRKFVASIKKYEFKILNLCLSDDKFGVVIQVDLRIFTKKYWMMLEIKDKLLKG